MIPQSIRRISILFGALALFGALLVPQASAAFLEQSPLDAKLKAPPPPDRYIVVFKDTVDHPRNLARNQVEQRNGKLGFVYRHAIKGYSAELPKAAIQGLRNDPRVRFITRDHVLHLFAQSTPTGIDRVFATANEALAINEEDDLRVDADVAVIDSGMDHEHEDLDVVARTDCATPEEGSFECIDNSGSPGAHGTHVAGTVGALDNDKGVVGVAPGARLWSVKVLLSGSVELFESSAVAGVDWVAAHSDEIDVANMSFGCTEGFHTGCEGLPALESAISSAVEEGVVMVAAAGNESTNAAKTYPASHPDVITVSALADFDGAPGGLGKDACTWWGDTDDTLADFSNYGPLIDVVAPGVCILSTLPGNSYGFSHGTSMAAPHVAGAAAILAAQDKPESKADVEAIRDTIIEEGNFDWTDTSGDGIQEPLLDVGDESAFRIVSPPTPTTWPAVDMTGTAARLVAWIKPEGYATSYWFEYGTTTEYGSEVPVAPQDIGTQTTKVIERIDDLEPNTTYHFRVAATNVWGTVYGKDGSFETRQSAELVADEYGTVIKGTPNESGENTLTIGLGWYCPTELGAYATAPTDALSTEVSGTCSSPYGGGPLTMNGCEVIFEPAESDEGVFEGTLTIGPEECGPITTKHVLGYCGNVAIDPHNGLTAAVEYRNREGETPSEDYVEITAGMADLHYTLDGICGSGSNNGFWEGSWELRAEDDETEEPVGLRVEGSEP